MEGKEGEPGVVSPVAERHLRCGSNPWEAVVQWLLIQAGGPGSTLYS